MIVRMGCSVIHISLDARVPKEHPLRPIRVLADEALGALTKEFEAMYAVDGRPSIAPERLLRASLLQVLPRLHNPAHPAERVQPTARAGRRRLRIQNLCWYGSNAP
jgi:transposase